MSCLARRVAARRLGLAGNRRAKAPGNPPCEKVCSRDHSLMTPPRLATTKQVRRHANPLHSSDAVAQTCSSLDRDGQREIEGVTRTAPTPGYTVDTVKAFEPDPAAPPRPLCRSRERAPGRGVGAAALALLTACWVLLTADAAGASTNAYVANTGSNDVAQYDIGAGGALNALTPATVMAGTGPEGVAVSPDGKSVYVANGASGSISEFDVAAGGLLSPKTQATVPAGTSPEGIAVSPDGKSVYVTDALSGGSVLEFDVGAGGLLSAKTPATVPAEVNPFGVAVSPDGQSVYVTNDGSDTVSQYDVDAGGRLSAKSPADAGTYLFPQGLAISPDGKSIYVADTGGDEVSQFDVGAGGLLSPKAPATVTTALTGPISVAVSPDGKSAYAIGSVGGSEYDVGAGGTLALKSQSDFVAGLHPFAMALTPDQGPVASFLATVAAPGAASHFDASASTDPDGTIARYDWDFGDGVALSNGGPSPTHTYAAAGTYTVRLTATDNIGCSTALVFTGQTAYCNPGVAATHTVTIASTPASPSPASPHRRLAAPVLSALTLRPAALRAARSGPTALAAAASAQPTRIKTGTVITYRDSQAATTSLRSESSGRCRGCKPRRAASKLPSIPRPRQSAARALCCWEPSITQTTPAQTVCASAGASTAEGSNQAPTH